ncbi:hypothetical protein EBR03_05525 [bacterium]|nr:hypothetical protein [bacterium]
MKRLLSALVLVGLMHLSKKFPVQKQIVSQLTEIKSIALCHRSSKKTGAWSTLLVSPKQAEIHLLHGDKIGGCKAGLEI